MKAEQFGRAIERAEACSPFLRRLIVQRRDVLDTLIAAGLNRALADARDQSLAEDNVRRALRRERQAVALTVAIADLAGAPLERVVRALSDFADAALDRAIAAAFAERGADAQGFVALALGKQGSRELNYSSDIDPILLFDPERMPRRAREEPGEAAARIARTIVSILQEPTKDGIVLRVDLRLRPASEISPPAVSLDAAITHYESSALPWERAAFIRARSAAGDIAMGERFLDAIHPFVWRRALDYGALGELRALSRRIRDHHHQSQQVGPGYDVKRGRGGIREVEFFAQIHQLIHGGREPALRAPATLDALAALAEAGRIEPDVATTLADAYRTLRTIEHRLQMIEDHQTHRLPQAGEAMDQVARLAGLTDGGALLATLAPRAAAVGTIYDALEDDAQPTLPSAPDALKETLARSGFGDVDRASRAITAWREGTVRTTRSPAARAALETVLPALIEALGQAPEPDIALLRFDDLVTGLPSAVNLFRLLGARPGLLSLLAGILSHAPTLAGALGRRADLLDGLIDATALDTLPPLPELIATLARAERGEDYQGGLDRVRREVGERRFALGVQIVTHASDPIAAGQGYARLAEAAIEVLASAAVAEFEAAHGRVPGGELVILALGRLGGGVMTHASDLDLVYLFTGDFLAESEGGRALGATTYFNRLAQRVTAALSVPTASGPLYPVDTRLRPSGTQGLLAVSLDSFARYEAENAWTWEHMALTRARPVFGSAKARAAVAEVIAATLRRARDPAMLTADATRMRSDIARHKPPAGPLDVKLIEGGLVDAEFAVHLLQLRAHVGQDPRLDEAVAALEAAGLLAPGFGDAVRLLTRMLIVLRLVGENGGEPAAASRDLVAHACGQADWAALLERYEEARASIGGEWRRVAAG